MPLQSLSCPTCGAPDLIRVSDTLLRCGHCGGSVEEEKENIDTAFGNGNHTVSSTSILQNGKPVSFDQLPADQQERLKRIFGNGFNGSAQTITANIFDTTSNMSSEDRQALKDQLRSTVQMLTKDVADAGGQVTSHEVTDVVFSSTREKEKRKKAWLITIVAIVLVIALAAVMLSLGN